MTTDWDDLLLQFVLPIVVVIVGAVIGWWLNSRVEAIRRATEKLQDERRRIYMKLLEPYIQVFASHKGELQFNKAVKQLVSVEYMRIAYEWNLMGSDEAIRARNDLIKFFRDIADTDHLPTPAKLVKYWGGLLLAIRRDLGDKKTKLTELDMLLSQISDIHRAKQ